MSNSKPSVETPSIKRRLISMLYDTFLATAVAALGMTVFTFATLRLPAEFRVALGSLTLFLVLGAYFVHAWAGSGFTLAMKTWRIKLVKVGYAKVPMKTAILRYVLSWGFVLPAILVGFFLTMSLKMKLALLGANVLAWAMTALLDKDRQFLHDRLAGTRLIALPKLAKGALIT
jgi:uncharacterized RDD family membrane protein YckC